MQFWIERHARAFPSLGYFAFRGRRPGGGQASAEFPSVTGGDLLAPFGVFLSCLGLRRSVLPFPRTYGRHSRHNRDASSHRHPPPPRRDDLFVHRGGLLLRGLTGGFFSGLLRNIQWSCGSGLAGRSQRVGGRCRCRSVVAGAPAGPHLGRARRRCGQIGLGARRGAKAAACNLNSTSPMPALTVDRQEQS